MAKQEASDSRMSEPHLDQVLGQGADGILIQLEAGQQRGLAVALHVQDVLDPSGVVVDRLAVRDKLDMVRNRPACQPSNVSSRGPDCTENA